MSSTTQMVENSIIDAMYRPSRAILSRVSKPLSATPGLGQHHPFTTPFSTTPTSLTSQVNTPYHLSNGQHTNLPKGPVLNSTQPQDPTTPSYPHRPLQTNHHPRHETISSSRPQKDPIRTRRGAPRQDGRPIRRRRRLGRRVRRRAAGGDEAVGQGQHVSVHLGALALGLFTTR